MILYYNLKHNKRYIEKYNIILMKLYYIYKHNIRTN